MTTLDKFERWMELLGDAGARLKNELLEDAVDRLEGKAVTLRPGVEIAAGAVKFVFDGMASAYAAYLAELEDFVRDTPARNGPDPVADYLMIGEDFKLVDEVFDSGDFELVYEEEGDVDK